MYLVEVATGKQVQVVVAPVIESDFQHISTDRFFFDWHSELDFDIYKLAIPGSDEIVGLISLESIPEEMRIHVRLLTVSIENVGSEKLYERIAGNLLAFTARKAVTAFGEFGCISLKPKTNLVRHYVERYNMSITGASLSLMVPEIFELINTYDNQG